MMKRNKWSKEGGHSEKGKTVTGKGRKIGREEGA